MLEAAFEGIRGRGRASVGDRTMLDALHPAAVAARRAAAEGSDVEEVLEAAAEGAEEGARATATMVARAGRSIRMGERALGHPDPGAVSIAIMLRAAADRLKSPREEE
jgi:phosphoenolpyruvate---glycerone phosphotransferase subunit DhaL